MGRNPFSVGRWVCGRQFFGRDSLISDLLQSHESCHWIIGKRRIGKTSLLRQIERRVNLQDPNRFALFWDIQGSFDGTGLLDSLCDAMEDSEDNFPEKWTDLDFDFQDESAPATLLKKFSRCLQQRDMRLLLLIDETEELINIGKQDPGLLSKIRRFFQTNRNAQTFIVSSPRLEDLSHSVSMDTSPFLHGFSVSYLGNFSWESCKNLLSVGIQDIKLMQRIFDLTDGNPFEAQIIAKNYFEVGSLESTLVQLETNPTLNQTIEVNFNLLNEDERSVLRDIHCGPVPFQDFERALTVKLLRMGYLKKSGREDFTISSYFQSKWLSLNLIDYTQAKDAPADVATGILLNVQHKDTILKRVVDIYQIFLEIAQKGKRLESPSDCFQLSQESKTVVLNRDHLQLVSETRSSRPWLIAVEELKLFLEQYVEKDDTWSIFRFHQMANKGPEHYSEKDFLDLMMLIAEEASIEG